MGFNLPSQQVSRLTNTLGIQDAHELLISNNIEKYIRNALVIFMYHSTLAFQSAIQNYIYFSECYAAICNIEFVQYFSSLFIFLYSLASLFIQMNYTKFQQLFHSYYVTLFLHFMQNNIRSLLNSKSKSDSKVELNSCICQRSVLYKRSWGREWPLY